MGEERGGLSSLPAREPSWPKVAATTVRLWLARRRSRKSATAPGGRRANVLSLLALVMAGLAAYAVTSAVLSRHPATSSAVGRSPAAVGGATAVRTQAAAWVAGQVSGSAIVACDAAMCAALQAQGLPAPNMVVLRAGASDPLGSDVVVATAAVRSQLGSRLGGVYAPVVIASFGSGDARIDVRAVAPDGAAAYQAAFGSDWAARRAAGAQLLRNPRIEASQAARDEIAAGQVDPRLLVTLAALAALHPVQVVDFGDAPPGASAGVPLRAADVAGPRGAPAGSAAAGLRSMRAFLHAQRPPYSPDQAAITQLPGGHPVLRIEFPAPSPLGLLGARLTP
jgi:hypothetical protein